MKDAPPNANVTVIPALRYRNAAAAIDWLCRAFGFRRHLVVPDGNSTVVHAQLTFGNGMIMLGQQSADNDYDRLIVAPVRAGGVTQAPYVIVDDADAHCARARAAGAEIMAEVERWDHGGRGYSCRDPEGHVWNFGTYDPWTDGANG